ncbi:MAG: DHH family phosphoesterase [Clostridia bacterium]|nr:DHH family phosphoesterase [Clostridia bacterium]
MSENPKQMRRMLAATTALLLLAVAVLAISVILIVYTHISHLLIVCGTLITYFLASLCITLITIARNRMAKGNFTDVKDSVFGTIAFSFTQNSDMPILICDEKGKIVWNNTVLFSGSKAGGVLHGKFLDHICNANLEAISQAGSQGKEVSFFAAYCLAGHENDTFCAKAYQSVAQGKTYYAIIFENITKTKELQEALVKGNTMIAYAMIDNLDELTQYVQELYSRTTYDVENILRRMMEKVGGIVRNYGNNKFMLVFAAEHLATFEKDRFDVLDEVREIRVGATALPITMSMGIAKISGSLYEKERATQAALDMALQRGGDQVAVKSEGKFEFYGGKTKTIQKQDKVTSRVRANELLGLISMSETVMIMGHKSPDFDAFASCIAVFRLAKICGTKAFIVCDKTTKTLEPCFKRIEGNPEYENVFIDKTEAQDMIRSDTLAVLVDVNNIDFCEAPDIVNTARDFVVIDHHRKTTEFKIPPRISYIEPSASSASELLSEFLEQIVPLRTLPKIEADFLLAGIFLDTKNFSHNTGVRTFSAATYLRSEGANPLDVKALFNMELDDFRSEANFETNVTMYRKYIALALNENEDNPPIARVNASRAADRLLTVSGVRASFAFCRIGDSVHISARSQGKINVQLILEKVGGGGHFDSAGAQIKGVDVSEASLRVREAIDQYYAENHSAR